VTSRGRSAPFAVAGLRAAYALMLSVCGVLAIGRILLGGLAFIAAGSAGLRDALARPSAGTWGHALLAAAAGREPAAQTLIEFAVSLVTVGLGGALLISGRRDTSMRLLGLAMLAAGGTCNLWTQATAAAVQEALGLSRAATGDVLLQSVAIAAFALTLLSYPAAHGGRLGPGRDELLTAAGGATVLGAAAATVLPPALSYVVLFGVSLPAVGLVLLQHRGRDDLTAVERTQVRLLFGVLVGAATIAAVLLLVTVLVRGTGWTGLALADPTTAAGPFVLRDTVLLFWFSRLVPVAIAAGALSAARRERLYAIQRRFSLGLVVALVAALAGGLFVVLHTMLDRLAEDGHVPPGIAAPAAAVPVALLVHPVHVRVERWVDRLLYGRRPTPYSVLAGIGSVSRTSLMNVPDLARVAEAVGRGLGARVCRLTVHRPDRPDRRYAWADSGADPGDALITLPIVRGEEQLGSITVDRATAAGLTVHRRRLVEDIADSLGAVLEANRLGIELERQLRAVRAHAADIAGSRRRLVAEMDAERRRIERDLHDGAQHHLVSLRLSLGLVEHRLTTGRVEDALASLDRVTGQIDDAESIMARTATGVTSPLLAQHGLVAALESELGAGRPAVSITTGGMTVGRRFPADLESAIWFCCLEAVNNARKHAPGATIQLTLACGPDRLEFGVHDDGPGWDMAASAGAPGRGMRNVTARVTAVGGLVSVRSEPGTGTRVDGWVPLPGGPAGAEGGPALVTAVRDAIQEALTRYGAAAAAERVRQIRAGLDQPAVPDAAGTHTMRRTAILAAWSALRALDVLLRSEPPAGGADPLLHRLDQIRSGAHELAEVDAIDALRSGTCDLGPDDVETAARLLGELGPDARSRLGLPPDADQSLVAADAEQALVVWRMRSSHPGTARSVRLLAATVVRSCERLLHGR
jgi:signal transduction histidine kinase